MATTNTDAGITLGDYQMMMQNQAKVFKDPTLQQAKIERDSRGQPVGIPGNFASVFKAMFDNGSKLAIRVFFRGNSERDRIYEQIYNHLTKWSKLSCLVDFKYHRNQVRTKIGRLPLVTMEWVDGQVLFSWLEDQCAANNQKVLEKFRDDWVQVIADLKKAKIAHGDLQHGNIMVDRSNTIRLVDYDGMCVPSLVGEEATEQGIDEYQHPQRVDNNRLSPDLDRYSALYIFVALYLLADNKFYRDLFLEQRRQELDYLFFDRGDFDEPGNSQVIKTIFAKRDNEAIKLVELLIKAYQGDMSDVPELESVLFSIDRVKEFLSVGRFDDAMDLWSRKPSSLTNPSVGRQILNATARVECRKRLEQLAAVGDEKGMAVVYDQSLMTGYPAANKVDAIAKDANHANLVLQQLNAAQSASDFRKLTNLWNKNVSLLKNRVSCAALSPVVDQWIHRNRLCDAFLNEFRKSTPNYAALIHSWNALQADPGAPTGHPEANPHRAKMDAIILRDSAWVKIASVANSATLSEESDLNLVAHWKPQLFNGWSTASSVKIQVDRARARLAILAQLNQLGSTDKVAENTESQIVQISGQLPTNYVHSLSLRIEAASKRLAALASLKNALQPPQVDSKIARAAESLERLNVLALVPSVDLPKVKLARQRKPVIEALARIDKDLPLAEFDPQILAAWESNQQLLSGCEEVKQLLPRFNDAIKRRDLLSKLESAIDANDRVKIYAVMRSPLLANYQLPNKWRNSVQAATRDLERLQRLKLAISNSDTAGFKSNFDVRVVRAYANDLIKYKPNMLKMVRSTILNREAIGLQLLPLKKHSAIKKKPGSKGVYRISWDWPGLEVTDKCLLLVSKQRPKPDSVPDEINSLLKEEVPRQAYQNGGGCKTILARAGFDGTYVSIWAMIDLGFEICYSEPLVLGMIEFSSTRQVNSRKPRKNDHDSGWFG